ncbi:MAG: hypothetical protein OEX19_07165, partial [Gammaproteobacteria bacterium]|nr:hypothetical protein [Gammaproteobacteria bacterium]
MDEKNISFRNFFIPLFILVFSLLISACENTLPTETTIELSVDFETITNKRTRGINGNVTRIDHIKFAISDTQNNLLSKAELRASGSLSIVAPPGKRLILNASAYLKNTLLYEGNTQIPALSPGQNFQANFLMHDISDDSSDPVLVDVGLNSKPGNGVGQGTQFSQSSTNTKLETGRFILFKSSASNLTRNDNNGMEDLFVRDLVTGHIINVHTDSNGNTAKPGSTPSSLESDISLDGHYVVFASNSDNLVPEDKNNVSDIFIKDVFTNKITRINYSTDFPIESGSDFPGISHDGSIVVFFSQDKLTEDGGIGIYLFDRIGETLHFIIPAATEPQISGNGNRILYKRTSDNSLNVYDVVQKTHVSITEGTSDDILFRKAFNKNGAYVAFIPSESRSNYAAGHTYLFSVDENKLFLASANNDGTPLSISGKEESNPGLSDDGRYVTFEANGFIYVKEVESGLLNAISFGINPFISASGQHIGYTESTTGHVFYMSNLAYTGTATTAGNPTPIESSFIFKGEDLILSWDKIDDASYYRIYLRNTPFPEDLRIAGRDVQQIYETRDGSINLGKDLDYNRNYYYLITTVTPEGEFRNAPVIEFYYEGVKPILSNSSHFYRPNSSELQANVIGYDPFGQTISYTLVTPPTRGEIIVNT